MAVAEPAVRPQKTPSGDGKTERDRLRMMYLIRRFEERTFQEYSKPGQKIGGFCHLYSGQEAISVGVAAVFDTKRDALINAYRCHGHSLALGMSADAAMAELFGKATGCSKGKGGSMHLFQAEVGNHGGHGIVGGHLPVAGGFAFAQKYKGTGGCTVCLFGDGAINQGTHNEALNLASLWKLPVVWIVENNGVAMGTQIERHSAERDAAKRGSGYNMPYYNVDGMDLDVVIQAVGEAFERGRRGDGPTYLSINTYRYRGHSMSDPLKYRSKEEAEKWKKRDPISIYFERIKSKGLITDEAWELVQEQVNAEVESSIEKGHAAPNPPLEDRFNDALAETYPFYGR
ncbi:MAG: thiamine pyrophosphate-dependent enzyme [Tepidisphaeraceae bacterium]